MSEPVVEGQVTEPQGQPDVTDGTGQQEGNPAWQEVLKELPESLHALVIPGLKKWDEGVNKRFQENAEKYKPYEPIISKYDSEVLDAAVQIYQALETNPRAIYDLIAQQYGYQTPAAAVTPPVVPPVTTDDDDNPYAQKIAELEAFRTAATDQQKQVIDYLVAQQQAQQLQQKTLELDAYMTKLHEANKDFPFDDQYVFTRISNGVTGEDAIKELRSMAEAYAKNLQKVSDNAPIVSGASGGLPSSQEDITRLDARATRELTTKLLMANRET